MTQGPVCPRICNGEFACPDLEISFAQVCLVWHLNLLLSCHELIAKEIWSVESSNAVTTCGPEPYSSYFTSWGRTKKTCRWKGGTCSWVFMLETQCLLSTPFFLPGSWNSRATHSSTDAGERNLVLWKREIAGCETMAAASRVAGRMRCTKWPNQMLKHQLKRLKCPKTRPLESRVDW